MEYPKVGVGGRAYKTQSLKKTALSYFNLFLESKDLPHTEETVCNVDLFREFGYYLAFYARSSKTEELLMSGTALTYSPSDESRGFSKNLFSNSYCCPRTFQSVCEVFFRINRLIEVGQSY